MIKAYNDIHNVSLYLILNHIILHLSITNYHNYCWTITFSGRGNLMRYRYNVLSNQTTTKNWTPTAIDCYLLGCSCYKCNLYKIYFLGTNNKCKMKNVVLELVRKYGAPKLNYNEY